MVMLSIVRIKLTPTLNSNFQILVQNKLKPDMTECDFYTLADKVPDEKTGMISAGSPEQTTKESEKIGDRR